MFKISILLVNTLIGFCYQFHFVEGIIGGYAARPGQFKYAAAVQTNINHSDQSLYRTKNACSGVIVNDDSVLSAAHCVIAVTSKFINVEWSVLVGGVGIEDKNSIEIYVEKIIVPLNFNPKQVEENAKVSIYSDLVLFKLEKKIGLPHKTESVIAVNLPPPFSTTTTHIDETAIITGFGILKKPKDITKSDINNPLQFAETTIIPNSWCQLMTNDSIRHDHICAQLKYRPQTDIVGVTKGDGGAPLVINGNLLIGILSHAKMSTNKKYRVEVYTKVAFYLPFINAAIRGEKQADNRVAIYEYQETRNGLKKTVKEI